MPREEGADGVRLGDIDRDRQMDIATGWRDGRTVRVYRQPERPSEPWKSETLELVCAAEDAVFAAVDREGAPDGISSCGEASRRACACIGGPARRPRRFRRPIRNALDLNAADPASW